jgi:hypothetical protein
MSDASNAVGIAVDALQAYINGLEEIRRAGVELKARADRIAAQGGAWSSQDTLDFIKWQQARDDAVRNAPT